MSGHSVGVVMSGLALGYEAKVRDRKIRDDIKARARTGR